MSRSVLMYNRCGLSLLLGLVVGAVSRGEPIDSQTAPLNAELVISLEPIVDLDEGWENPPQSSRTQCWWWWLNGNVTKDGITRDLEAMKAQGLGGANIVDAGGADQRGHRQVPHGPDFGTAAWRELFLHALAEADRLGLEFGLNIQSGWNLGGPTVKPEHAAKKITWSETTVAGGQFVEEQLAQPPSIGHFYRDVAALAVPVSSPDADEYPFKVTANSAQDDHPPELAVDDNKETWPCRTIVLNLA